MQRLPQRLLVVEDDVSVARALCRTLARAGFSVATARSCADACSLTQLFDVAILDLDLPDGNGVDLARTLLRSGQVPNVLFFTSCTDPTLLARARCLGSIVMKSLGTSPILAWLAAAAETPDLSDVPPSSTTRSPGAPGYRVSSSSVRRSRAR
ncbi:MAG TPA: response regulator [Polyangiaceae bacterium]|nr:response regulator [Polyangiaceae bacterium]